MGYSQESSGQSGRLIAFSMVAVAGCAIVATAFYVREQMKTEERIRKAEKIVDRMFDGAVQPLAPPIGLPPARQPIAPPSEPEAPSLSSLASQARKFATERLKRQGLALASGSQVTVDSDVVELIGQASAPGVVAQPVKFRWRTEGDGRARKWIVLPVE